MGNAPTIGSFRLTVRLLLLRAGAFTAVLLGLAPTGVGDEQRTVVVHQNILDLLLRGLVDELLVVSYDALGDRLPDRIHLRSVTSSSDANTDVDLGESFAAEQQNRLHNLHSESGRVHQVQRLTVNTDHTAAGLHESHCNRVLLATKGLDVFQGRHLSYRFAGERFFLMFNDQPRSLGSLKAQRLFGLSLIVFSVAFTFFVYFSILLVRFLPASGIWIIDFWRDNWYYACLIPASVPMYIAFGYWQWLSSQYFRYS